MMHRAMDGPCGEEDPGTCRCENQQGVQRQAAGSAIQWFAVRTKSVNPGRRTCVLGAEFETYRNQRGRVCKRRKLNTGTRIFVPEHLVRRAGFQVFLPVRKEWRQANQFDPSKELVTYPLMAGWMFVGWPDGQSRWSKLMELGVVAGVMATGGRPAKISEKKISELMQRWGGGVLSSENRRYMRRGKEFAVGDSVLVVAGPLLGLNVRVVDVSGPSARIVLKILGSEAEVPISTDYLEGKGS